MNIKENITVFICEHCGKRLFIKAAMERHEKNCYSNPENFRACSGCVHLEEIEATYYVDAFDGERAIKTKGFKCNKLDKLLYPFKVEKMDLVGKYPESFEGQEPMPKECEFASPY